MQYCGLCKAVHRAIHNAQRRAGRARTQHRDVAVRLLDVLHHQLLRAAQAGGHVLRAQQGVLLARKARLALAEVERANQLLALRAAPAAAAAAKGRRRQQARDGRTGGGWQQQGREQGAQRVAESMQASGCRAMHARSCCNACTAARPCNACTSPAPAARTRGPCCGCTQCARPGTPGAPCAHRVRP